MLFECKTLIKFIHIHKIWVKSKRHVENSFIRRKKKKKRINRHTFCKRVKCVNHELEDAVPHQTVVERCRASSPLEPWLGLS